RVPGGHPLAILSYGFWMSRFGGDAGVLNRTVRVNGHPVTIVGVAQRGFQGMEVGRRVDVMVPMMMKPQMTPTWDDLENRRSLWAYVTARLKPGVTRAMAEAAMQPVFHAIVEMEAPLFPDVGGDFRKRYIARTLQVV